MKDPWNGGVKAETVWSLLIERGYRHEVGKGDRLLTDIFFKRGGTRITVAQHRGIVTRAEFDRIKALLLR